MNAAEINAQFEAALVYATRLHAHQTRKIGGTLTSLTC